MGQQPVVAVPVGEALTAQLLPQYGVQVVCGSLRMDGGGCGKLAGAHLAVPQAHSQLLGFSWSLGFWAEFGGGVSHALLLSIHKLGGHCPIP